MNVQQLIIQANEAALSGGGDPADAYAAALGVLRAGGFAKKGNTIMDLAGMAALEAVRDEMLTRGLKDSRIIHLMDYFIDGAHIYILAPDYWQYIEGGRRAGAKRPPIPPIIAWMKRKRIAVGREGQVAWAIATAIARRGIKARPFVQKGADEAATAAGAVLEVGAASILVAAIDAALNG